MPVNMRATIAKAFLELSKTKSVDKITVKDLVERCGISRQTFYYHFQDILEVIEWSVQQAAQEILERSAGAEDPMETLRAFIRSSAEWDAFLQRLLHSQRREQVEAIFVTTIRAFLQELLARREPDPGLSVADAKVILDFCTYGTVGLLLENCGKSSMDREKLARQMYRLVFEKLEDQR